MEHYDTIFSAFSDVLMCEVECSAMVGTIGQEKTDEWIRRQEPKIEERTLEFIRDCIDDDREDDLLDPESSWLREYGTFLEVDGDGEFVLPGFQRKLPYDIIHCSSSNKCTTETRKYLEDGRIEQVYCAAGNEPEILSPDDPRYCRVIYR